MVPLVMLEGTQGKPWMLLSLLGCRAVLGYTRNKWLGQEDASPLPLHSPHTGSVESGGELTSWGILITIGRATSLIHSKWLKIRTKTPVLGELQHSRSCYSLH